MKSISDNVSQLIIPNSSQCPENVTLGSPEIGITPWKLTVGVILGLMVLSAVIGNILVILAVLTNRKLRRVTYFFVVSLAVADLLVSLLVCPLSIVLEVSGKWYFGYIVCLFWTSMDVMLCTASILNLCCISLDRYFAITKPLAYSTKRTKKLAYIMIGITWLASVIITCPPLLGWQEESRWYDPYSCELSKSPGYVIYSACGSFYLPLLVMSFVYIRIFLVTRRSSREFNLSRTALRIMGNKNRGEVQNTDSVDNLDDSSETFAAHGTSPAVHNSRVFFDENTETKQETALDSLLYKSSSDSGQNNHTNSTNCAGKCINRRPVRRPKKEKKIMRIAYMKERKTAKTLAIVVGCFALCWLPFFLIYLIRPLCGSSCSIDPALWSFVTWLGYFNSLCNPLIYAFYSKDFRQSFWILTLGRCTKSNRR